ncbi:hypothetical protein [Priestia endophytica]|nr:hypothetical protein [Priestia endophytica]
MEKKTGFICDESYFWHDTGNGALFCHQVDGLRLMNMGKARKVSGE